MPPTNSERITMRWSKCWGREIAMSRFHMLNGGEEDNVAVPLTINVMNWNERCVNKPNRDSYSRISAYYWALNVNFSTKKKCPKYHTPSCIVMMFTHLLTQSWSINWHGSRFLFIVADVYLFAHPPDPLWMKTHFDGQPFIRFIIELMSDFRWYQKSNDLGLLYSPDVLSICSTKATSTVTTCYNTNLNPHYGTQLTSQLYWQIFLHFNSVLVCKRVNAHVHICLLLLLFVVRHVGVNEVEYVLLCY